METVVTYLAKLGHHRIARVGGFARYWHSRLRSEEFTSAAAAAGLTAVSVEADYSAEHGARTTRSLLGSAEPPTAIVYDNDVMAAAGLGVAQRMGRNVPADVSIVSWDDSALCELIHPAITALRRNIPAAGSQAARMLQRDGGRRLPGELPGGPARLWLSATAPARQAPRRSPPLASPPDPALTAPFNGSDI